MAGRPAAPQRRTRRVRLVVAIATVASEAMKVDDAGRFWPGRAVTGEEVVTAIARVRQLAGR
jgi:hypothetical protein